MSPERAVVEADGGSRGNPGTAGYGAVVLDADTGRVLAERAEALGVTTNNVAEYSGLIAGLTAARDLGARDVEVRMDSKLVVEQMAGRWQVKNAGLRPLAREAAALVRDFERVTFTWIPRERNKRADALANRAMDGESVHEAAAGPEPEPPKATWEPRLARPTRLILVRHGETRYTAERRYSGRGDVSLSPRGERQARAAAGRVGALAADVAAIVTSPLTRARQTADALADRYRRRPVVEADLVECDFGEWDGLTYAEVRDRWPDALDAWMSSTAVAPPGGESFDAVADRTRRAVAALHARYAGRTVVVVTHVSPIKVTLRDALDGGHAFLHRLHLDPAGVSIVDGWPNGALSVPLVNDTSHLSNLD